jgi:hypothetical protein
VPQTYRKQPVQIPCTHHDSGEATSLASNGTQTLLLCCCLRLGCLCS